MYLYHIISGIKFLLGTFIIATTYTSINVYEDPAIAIGLGFLGIFIASRGASYFLFLWIQKTYRHLDQLTLIKESYKLSLLFGIYIIINFLLILLGRWSKFIGILLFGGFVRLQISLFANKDTHHDTK